MKLIISILLFLFAGYLLSSCSTTATAKENAIEAASEEKLVDYDLTSYGVPAIVKAPENSKIKKGMGPASVNIDGGNGFLMLVLYKGVAVEGEIKALKQMASDKDFNPGFEAVEVDETSGYLLRYNGGEKSFAWGINLKSGGCVYAKDDLIALAGTGKMHSTAANAERMLSAAKLMKGTK